MRGLTLRHPPLPLPAPNHQPSMSPNTSRRAFLKKTSAAVAIAAIACDKDAATRLADTATKGAPTGGTMGPHDTGASISPVTAATTAQSAAEKMDAMHEAGIKAFPAKTAGKGNQLLAPRMEGNVKV